MTRDLPASGYGTPGRPAVLAVMAPVWLQVRIGLAVAVLAVLLAVLAISQIDTDFSGGGTRLWAIVVGVGALVMLVLSAIQVRLWSWAMQEWRGVRDVDLRRWLRPSQVLRVVSYVVGLLTVAALGLMLAEDPHLAGTVVLLAVLATLATIAAQVLAAGQLLLVDGPDTPEFLLDLLRIEHR